MLSEFRGFLKSLQDKPLRDLECSLLASTYEGLGMLWWFDSF